METLRRWLGTRQSRAVLLGLLIVLITVLAVVWYASLWTVPRLGIPPT
jgi:hypothetical protein